MTVDSSGAGGAGAGQGSVGAPSGAALVVCAALPARLGFPAAQPASGPAGSGAPAPSAGSTGRSCQEGVALRALAASFQCCMKLPCSGAQAWKPQREHRDYDVFSGAAAGGRGCSGLRCR